VVDDDKFNATLMKEVCENAGYVVTMVNDSMQVMDIATEDPPDLILLDIMMSTKDGFQVCRELRTERRTSTIPVILVTAIDNLESKIRGIELGADDYITKPFRLFDLQARISSALDASGNQQPTSEESTGQHQGLRLRGYRQLRRDLEYEFRRALRYKHSLCCSILVVKDYEEIYTEQSKKDAAGLIAATVTILQRFLRSTDRVYRLEEDVFIVMMPETNQEQGNIPITRILRELSKPQVSNCGPVALSSAIVSFPDEDSEIRNSNEILKILAQAVSTRKKT